MSTNKINTATLPNLADPSNYGNQPGQGSLRPGGKSVSELPQTENNLPSTPSKSAKSQQPALMIVRDCIGGNERIRDQSTLYLPQAPGEDGTNYNLRLNRSVFFNVTGKTVEGLTGFVFSKDPVLSDDVPAVIKDEHWENLDLAGTHGDVFVRDVFQDALSAGHAGILVEYPATGGNQTAADEQKDIRPYWVPIKKENILSWRTATINGHLVLTQLVLKECTCVPDGEYGEKEQKRYRVLYNDNGVVGFRLLEVMEDRRVTLVAEGTYPTQQEIPFVEISTAGRCSFLESKPPLLDLAYLNVAHYQLWSDRSTSLHKTCVPIWVETGIDQESDGVPKPLILGPNTARRFSNPQASATYQSHSGAALAEVSSALEELKSDMSVFGLSMLSPQHRRAETAEAKRIDKTAGDSQLSVSARGLEDGLERALGFHARYLKLPSGGSVSVNRDFESTTMPADMLTAYVNAIASAGLPVRVLLDAMQRGGLLEPDEDLDAMEAEVMASQAAKADQARVEAQAQVDAQNAGVGTAPPPKAAKAVA